MKRFLCLSLCLGLVASACKKPDTQEDADAAKANAKGRESAGTTTNTNTVTKRNKEAVLKACLPQINTVMLAMWEQGVNNLFLRRSTAWNTTAAVPLVVLYTRPRLPLQFQANGFGLGKDAATVTKNLNAMAASKVIQDQFVAREDNASGWRVHISQANTNVTIPRSEAGKAPEAPDADTGIIIYDRENVVVAGPARISGVVQRATLDAANNNALRGGWFDCEVDDTTQDVTVRFARAELTEAAA